MTPEEYWHIPAEEMEVLSPEREQDLARRARNGDSTARDELVSHNLRLVMSLANKATSSGVGVDQDDKIQDGMMGLMRAIESFDPDLGFKFSTYAVWWINQAIGRGIANGDRAIRIPVHALDRLNAMNKFRKQYQQETGEIPDRETMRNAFSDLSEDTFNLLYSGCVEPLSLDNVVRPDEGEDGTVGDLIAFYNADIMAGDTVSSVERDNELEDLKRRVLFAVETYLDPREQEVIKCRFGLCGRPISTLQDVGEKMGITRERIRQIENKALRKLRMKGYNMLNGLDGHEFPKIRVESKQDFNNIQVGTGGGYAGMSKGERIERPSDGQHSFGSGSNL